MTELSPGAKDLFERAKGEAFDPSDARIERVGRVLDRRLAAGPGASEVGRVVKWSKIAGAGIVGIGLVAAGARLLFHGSANVSSPSAPATTASAAAPATASEPASERSVPSAPAPVATASESSAPAADRAKGEAPRVASSKPGAAAGVDTLADEVRIMSSARASLRQNAYPRTLTDLDEYAARYPKGLFREEELALRVLALCGEGRTAEARRALESLERMAPKSRQLERARSSCAGANR